MPTRKETEATLRHNVAVAAERYIKARDDFDAMTADFPSRVPDTDGALQVRMAGLDHTTATRSMDEARTSLNNFTRIPALEFEQASYAASVIDVSNRTILEFVRRDLELGETFLQLAITEHDFGEKGASDMSVRHALSASAAARRFLDKTYSTTPGERERLNACIEKLEADIETAVSSFRQAQPTER